MGIRKVRSAVQTATAAATTTTVITTTAATARTAAETLLGEGLRSRCW